MNCLLQIQNQRTWQFPKHVVTKNTAPILEGFGYHFPPHLSPPEFRQEFNNSLVPVYALHEEKYPGRGKRNVLTAIKMAQAKAQTQTFQSEAHRGKNSKFPRLPQ